MGTQFTYHQRLERIYARANGCDALSGNPVLRPQEIRQRLWEMWEPLAVGKYGIGTFRCARETMRRAHARAS